MSPALPTIEIRVHLQNLDGRRACPLPLHGCRETVCRKTGENPSILTSCLTINILAQKPKDSAYNNNWQ